MDKVGPEEEIVAEALNKCFYEGLISTDDLLGMHSSFNALCLLNCFYFVFVNLCQEQQAKYYDSQEIIPQFIRFSSEMLHNLLTLISLRATLKSVASPM